MYTLLTFAAAVAIYALVRLLTDTRSALPIGSQFREYLQAWRTWSPVDAASEGDFTYEDSSGNQSGVRGWMFRHRVPPIQTVETDLAWAALTVFSAATVLTHNTAVLFLLATNLFVLGLMLVQRRSRAGAPRALQAPTLANWVKAQVGIVLLWSPWIVIFVQQSLRVYQEFWIPQPTWETIAQTLRSLLNASAPGQISQVMTWVLCAVLGLGLLYYRKQRSILLLLVTLFAVPFLGELLVSIYRPIFFGRTLIWLTIPLFLLLAAGVVQLRFRLLTILVLGVLAANYLFATGDYYRFFQKEDWSTPAGYVANYAEKGDLVLFNSNFVVVPFNYYFEDYEERYALEVEKRGVPLDLFASGRLEPKMTARDIPQLVALLGGHDRVWLVYSHDSYTDPLGLIPRTLAAQRKLMQTREFYGGRVQLYAVP